MLLEMHVPTVVPCTICSMPWLCTRQSANRASPGTHYTQHTESIRHVLHVAATPDNPTHEIWHIVSLWVQPACISSVHALALAQHSMQHTWALWHAHCLWCPHQTSPEGWIWHKSSPVWGMLTQIQQVGLVQCRYHIQCTPRTGPMPCAAHTTGSACLIQYTGPAYTVYSRQHCRPDDTALQAGSGAWAISLTPLR